MTTDDLLEALREFGQPVPMRPVGEGWMTIPEMAAKEKVTPAIIRKRMDNARERGLAIESATGSLLGDDGKLKKAVFFRVKR